MMEPEAVQRRNVGFPTLNVASLVLQSSLHAKVLSCLFFIAYFISFSPVVGKYLCVIPGYVLPPNLWIWTLLTHNFLQSHIWMVIIDICIIFVSSKFLESVWSSIQLLVFVLVVTTSSAVATSLVYMFIYYVTRNTDYLFETFIYGLGAYIGGFTVVLKQFMPAEPFAPVPHAVFKNLPLLSIIISTPLSWFGVFPAPYPMQISFGVLFAWIYLRFYQRHTNGSKGDMAEDFTFATFFPAPLDTAVAVLANTLFAILIRLKVCKKPQRKYDVSSPTTITVTLPGTDPADAERRRQLAIKALNERLNRTNEEVDWPGLEDNEEDNPVEVISADDVKVDEPHISDAASPAASSSSVPVKPELPNLDAGSS